MKKFLIILLASFASSNTVFADNYLERRGNYLVCPNNNRIVNPSNLPISASAPFRLRKLAKKTEIKIQENTNSYRLDFFSQPSPVQLNENIFDSPLLLRHDSWIAIPKEDLTFSDTKIVIKNLLSKDIKPSTSYLVQEYKMSDGIPVQRGNMWIDPYDKVVFVNSSGIPLTLVFKPNDDYPIHALDRNGKRIEIRYDSVPSYVDSPGPSNFQITCNTNDFNITYKGVFLFKMRLFDEFGVESLSPYLFLNTKFIMKTEPAPESNGGFQF